MGHIEVESPFAAELEPGVMNFKRLLDTMWRMDLRDAGAVERQDKGWYRLMALPQDLLRRGIAIGMPLKGCYSFCGGRWEFSSDVNVDNVSVRFSLKGELYEIPAIPEGGDYCPRRPVRVLMLQAARELDRAEADPPAHPEERG